ncbi:MAG: hypothetical protein ACFFD4_02360 [Candidatus Odinarchaeota archaeon]
MEQLTTVELKGIIKRGGIGVRKFDPLFKSKVKGLTTNSSLERKITYTIQKLGYDEFIRMLVSYFESQLPANHLELLNVIQDLQDPLPRKKNVRTGKETLIDIEGCPLHFKYITTEARLQRHFVELLQSSGYTVEVEKVVGTEDFTVKYDIVVGNPIKAVIELKNSVDLVQSVGQILWYRKTTDIPVFLAMPCFRYGRLNEFQMDFLREYEIKIILVRKRDFIFYGGGKFSEICVNCSIKTSKEVNRKRMYAYKIYTETLSESSALTNIEKPNLNERNC